MFRTHYEKCSYVSEYKENISGGRNLEFSWYSRSWSSVCVKCIRVLGTCAGLHFKLLLSAFMYLDTVSKDSLEE